MPLAQLSVDQLLIEDEASFASIELYPRLKEVLRRADHRFYVPSDGKPMSWDRTVFLNLTYWGGPEGGDVLGEPSLPADVVAHIAWHHLASEASGAGDAPSPHALFFGESMASAFDLYLLGRLYENAPDSDFVVSQTPILAEVADNAGLGESEFAALLGEVTADPARAFEDLRALLFDASVALFAARSAPAAAVAIEAFSGHRFYPLLHHYQLSNWILYARAYGGGGSQPDPRVAELDRQLRAAPSSLAWLGDHWLRT